MSVSQLVRSSCYLSPSVMSQPAVDVSDSAVQDAWKQLTNDKSPVNWYQLTALSLPSYEPQAASLNHLY